MNNNYLSYTDITYIPKKIHLQGVFFPQRLELTAETLLGEQLKSSIKSCDISGILNELQSLAQKNSLHCIVILSFEAAHILEDLPIKNKDLAILEFFIVEFDEINTNNFLQSFTNEKENNVELPYCELINNTSHEYKENYVKILEHFRAGDIYEFVPSRKMEFKTNVESMFQYLCTPMALQKAPYRFALEFMQTKICGASPEILIELHGNKVTSRPISGSIRRNGDSDELTEQEQLELKKLYESEKEKCELDMLIDLARNDLNRVCTNVTVSKYRQALILEHIIHTQATVTGILKSGCNSVQALLSAMNAGTLVGAPKRKSMEIISELEKQPRGYYGGNLVHMKPDGNLTAIILIRTAYFNQNILKVQAGSSVVIEANEQYEYWECGSKLKHLLRMINQENLCFNDGDHPSIVNTSILNDYVMPAQLGIPLHEPIKHKLLMIDNFDSFTYNLISLFESCGCHVDVIKNNVKEFDFSSYDGVLLSPGPSHPREAGILIDHVQNLIGKKPLFGVCLGFQAIIEALGGSLARLQNPLHGKSRTCYVKNSKILFANLPSQFNVARYHSLYANKIPSEVNIVAYDELETPLALEGSAQGPVICGVQFHPESFLTGELGLQIIKNWLEKI